MGPVPRCACCRTIREHIIVRKHILVREHILVRKHILATESVPRRT